MLGFIPVQDCITIHKEPPRTLKQHKRQQSPN